MQRRGKQSLLQSVSHLKESWLDHHHQTFATERERRFPPVTISIYWTGLRVPGLVPESQGQVEESGALPNSEGRRQTDPSWLQQRLPAPAAR